MAGGNHPGQGRGPSPTGRDTNQRGGSRTRPARHRTDRDSGRTPPRTHAAGESSRDEARRRPTAHRRRHRSSTPSAAAAAAPPAALPYGARPLSRADLVAFEPLFAHYLDLQKQLCIADLDAREVRGRWKSFVNRWNRGDLPEGWYDPEMFVRLAQERAAAPPADGGVPGGPGAGVGTGLAEGARGAAGRARGEHAYGDEGEDNDDDDDDDDEGGWGPSLPRRAAEQLARAGPAVPGLQDLEERRAAEAEAEQRLAADLRLERKADRRAQADRLDELVPRAEPGTRERQLEKRRAVADKMREFQAGAGDMEEVADGELMGGGGGGGDAAEEYRRALEGEKRRKTEREIWREELARARNAERERRVQEYREREMETQMMLRELARKRFG